LVHVLCGGMRACGCVRCMHARGRRCVHEHMCKREVWEAGSATNAAVLRGSPTHTHTHTRTHTHARMHTPTRMAHLATGTRLRRARAPPR
jgi:hypothetical protein